MHKLIGKSLSLLAMLLATTGLADTDLNNSVPLEARTVTIRAAGMYPLAELRPCLRGCPMRLLPFAPGAQIYIGNEKRSLASLEDGLVLFGTVFLSQSEPLAIRDIIAE